MDTALYATVARLAQTPTLPAPPALLPRLMRVLSGQDFALADVVTVVESDPSAAAGVITAANSALTRRAVAASSVRDAVSRLGAETTRGIVIHNAMRAAFQPRHPSLAPLLSREWGLALDMAALLRPMAGAPGLPISPDEAVTLGLLHNLGVPPLLCAPPGEAWDATEFYRAVLPHAAALGGLLARRWQLGETAYRVAIGCHRVVDGPWEPVDTVILARQILAQQQGFMPAQDTEVLDAVRNKAMATLGDCDIEAHLIAQSEQLATAA